MYGWKVQEGRMSLLHVGYMAITNSLGAVVYATRVTMLSSRKDRQLLIIQIPERLFPFKFDIFGSSHQIFHVLVVIAAWLHLNGLLHASRVANNTAYAC